MTNADWIALAVVALMAVSGLRRGLVAGLLSVGGWIGGAILGARLAPHVIHKGALSPYTPLVALAGAIVLGIVGAALGGWVGKWVRRSFFVIPPLKALDVAGGTVLGAIFGLAVVWVVAIVALHFPGQQAAREQAQRSAIAQRLMAILPPDRVLKLLLKSDRLPSLPSIPGLATTPEPPAATVVEAAAVTAAKRSVVRVLGTACGLGIQGTGWSVAPQLVVTAAHVVAGVRGITVVNAAGRHVKARAVVFDPKNDLAVLRAAGLGATALHVGSPADGRAVAVIGFPKNGPLRVTPGRMGTTATVTTKDAYGHGPVQRSVTSVTASVSPGDSGAPAVDDGGAVEATIFARSGADPALAYGVPSWVLRGALARAGRLVSTGPCVK